MEILGDGLIKNDSLSNLKEFLISKEFSDAKLIIGNKCFDVHRVVLASQSPFFKALFSDTWNKSNTITLNEEFLDPEIMEDLLKYMYSNKIYLTTENVYSLCVASHFLKMENLLKEIEKYWSERLSLSNIFGAYKLSKKLNLSLLKQNSLNFIAKNYDELFENPYIQELSYEDIIMMIKDFQAKHDDDSDDDDDDDNDAFNDERFMPCLFDLIINWVEHDKENRISRLQALLGKVPEFYSDVEFLTKKLATNHIVWQSESCLRGVMNAIFKEIETFYSDDEDDNDSDMDDSDY